MPIRRAAGSCVWERTSKLLAKPPIGDYRPHNPQSSGNRYHPDRRQEQTKCNKRAVEMADEKGRATFAALALCTRAAARPASTLARWADLAAVRQSVRSCTLGR